MATLATSTHYTATDLRWSPPIAWESGPDMPFAVSHILFPSPSQPKLKAVRLHWLSVFSCFSSIFDTSVFFAVEGMGKKWRQHDAAPQSARLLPAFLLFVSSSLAHFFARPPPRLLFRHKYLGAAQRTVLTPPKCRESSQSGLSQIDIKFCQILFSTEIYFFQPFRTFFHCFAKCGFLNEYPLLFAWKKPQNCSWKLFSS